MPTAETQMTIYNGALDIVGSRPVSSLAEASPECRWLNRNFTAYVQSTLRRDLWNFATELHELNLQVDKPPFRWGRGYDLPPGWLRVVPPMYGGVRGGRPIKYEVKGNSLYSNEGTPFYCELVMDRQVPGEWDALFADLIKARLARGMAHSLTHKASFKQLAQQAEQEAYDIAQQVNAFESPMDEVEQHDIIRVRGTRW